MTVMTFGANCSPCIAHYIKNENAKKYEYFYSRTVKAIVENHYVNGSMASKHHRVYSSGQRRNQYPQKCWIYNKKSLYQTTNM